MITFNAPINSVSFGIVSTAILREAYNRKLDCRLFPISQVDLSAQPSDPEFDKWLRDINTKAYQDHSRDNPIIKLWHINGLFESFSKEQAAITFHECSDVTPIEKNILKNQKKVFVTSQYSKKVFNEFGIDNVEFLQLGFDKTNFYKINQPSLGEDITVWVLPGKLEPCRKRTLKSLQAWVKKFGNNKNHRLHAAIFNPFIKPEDQLAIIGQALNNKKYWNVEFFGWVKTNAEYNAIINSGDIVLGLSGGETFDIPVFSSVALGKHCLALKAHVYLDYLNDENAVLVPPSGRIQANDGMFFRQGDPFNQGAFYDWSEDDVISGMEEVLKRVKNNKLNTNGNLLQSRSYSETLDTLIQNVL